MVLGQFKSLDLVSTSLLDFSRLYTLCTWSESEVLAKGMRKVKHPDPSELGSSSTTGVVGQ